MTIGRWFVTTGLLLFVLAGCRGESSSDGSGKGRAVSFSEQRLRMVDALEAAGVKDERVLEALRRVKRHRFVPREFKYRAYDGEPLPIGEEQTISSPHLVGLMTELLDLDGSEKVLEIGTGSGYQAAVLSEIVGTVYTMEIRKSLADTAGALLASLGYDRIHVRCGDGYKGWPEEAPFDAIIVTAAPLQVPEELVRELAPGGVLVVPVGERNENQILLRITKDAEGKVHRKEVTLVHFVPMIHKTG